MRYVAIWLSLFVLLMMNLDMQKKIDERPPSSPVDTENFATKVDIVDIKRLLPYDLLNRFGALESQSVNDTAFLEPGKEGFSIVRTQSGNLLIRISDIQPYANGYKAILSVGNPYVMTFNNVTLSVKYSAPYPTYEADDKDYLSKVEKWNKSIKSVESGTATLLPGRWNNIPVTLAPAEKDEISTLSIKINTKGIGLY